MGLRRVAREQDGRRTNKEGQQGEVAQPDGRGRGRGIGVQCF